MDHKIPVSLLKSTQFTLRNKKSLTKYRHTHSAKIESRVWRQFDPQKDKHTKKEQARLAK